MEPEGSLLCSQKLAIGFYPEPDTCILHPPILFPKIFLILSSPLCLGILRK